MALRRFDLETQTPNHLGQHDESISQVVYSRAASELLALSFPFNPVSIVDLLPDTLVTGSFDRTLRLWDPRSSTPCTASHTLPERVYQMDVTGTTVVIGLAGRLFHIYDVRKIKEGEEPLQRRESSMKFMTRAVACMSDGKGMSL